MQKLIALVVILIGLFFYVLFKRFIKYRKDKDVNNYLAELRQKGKKIIVPFEECELKTREYYEEQTPDPDRLPSRVEMLDALYDQERMRTTTKKVISVLVYKHTDPTGKEIAFRSEAIEMPVERLRFIMENMKQAAIYVDENNWSRYYFDLSFINSHG